MAEQIEQLDETIQLLSDLLQSRQDSEFIESFEALHDFEMAQVYAELPEQFRAVAWRLLPTDVLAAVFDNLDVDEVDIAGLLEEMPPQRGAEILQAMYTDNAVDLLQEMSSGQIATYLSLMPKADADAIQKLINYDDQTAGSLMSTEYLAVKEDLKVGEVMRLVKKQALEAESISYVYVLDKQGVLVGVISLRDLLTHPDEMPVSEITNDRIISVRAGDDQKEVAQIVADYNFLSIPVTDDNHRLLGVITVDDIVDVIDEEAVEDYSGLAAVNVSQINDTPWHSAVKRIPWLIALLLLGMLTATVIGSFDGLVRQVAILAAFISLITGTAGNAGTQSLALAVRRIAVGSENSGLRDFLSEVFAGLIVGLATGLSVFAIVTIWKHNTILGFAVGVAMTMAIMVANLAGYLIPLLIDKMGFDPAVASGPFITTLSDLTSVLIYFNVAQLFLAHLAGG